MAVVVVVVVVVAVAVSADAPPPPPPPPPPAAAWYATMLATRFWVKLRLPHCQFNDHVQIVIDPTYQLKASTLSRAGGYLRFQEMCQQCLMGLLEISVTLFNDPSAKDPTYLVSTRRSLLGL